MRYWIFKTEPDAFSFDDLLAAPGGRTAWDGVRNYQVRNFMRDDMRVGDRVLVYHSSTRPPGVAGLAEIASPARPDPSQFDPASPYFDLKATEAEPRWLQVEVRALGLLPRFVTLDELRAEPALAGMRLLKRGNRLSILPVEPEEAERILEMAGGRAAAPRSGTGVVR